MESRLLLSNDLAASTQYPSYSQYSLYGPIQIEKGSTPEAGGLPSAQVSGDPRTLATIDSTQDPAFPPRYRMDGLAGMMVYDEDDPSHPYQVKIFDPTSAQTGPSGVGPFAITSAYPTTAMAAAQFAGSLETAQDSMSYRVPVGPGIDSIRFGISPRDHSPLGKLPVFDDVALYDGTGRKLAEVIPHWDAAHLPPLSLLVSLANAPEGSQLVLRISASGAGASQRPSDGQGLADSSPALSGSDVLAVSDRTSFILTIQEFEKMALPSQAASGPDAISEQSSTGFDAPPAKIGRNSGAVSDNGQDASDSEGETILPGSGTPAPATPINVRIPTGPLIARGATPMGGNLTIAVMDDPAPGIERFDGMLAAFLGGLEGEDELLSDREGLIEGREATPGQDATDELREHIASAGETSGNLPLVTVQPLGPPDAAQSAAFLGSLPALTAETPTAGPIAERLELAPVPIGPTGGPAPSRRVASWVSAAFGLTLGLTLTSGTYLPDLVNHVRDSIRRRSRRRVRRLEGNRNRPG